MNYGSSLPPLHSGAIGRRWRRHILALVVLASCFLNQATGAATARANSELTASDIRAAYLFNFTKFVSWPRPATGSAPDTLIIVVHDDPATFRVLQEVSRSAVSNGRPLVTRHVQSGDPIPTCHVLYVGKVNAREASRVLLTPAARAALTVGIAESFIELGGIIQMLEVRNRLVFDVDLGAAEARQLTISSAMLKVAHSVHRQANGGAGVEK